MTTDWASSDSESSWEHAEASRLRSALPAGTTVEVYGSTATGELDGWSDLDVEIALASDSVDLRDLYGGELWAWSDADGEDGQVVRVVLRDGRRIDLRIVRGRIRGPAPLSDGSVRFDLALAAARLGRGDRLVGLHLLLGVARETLVTALLRRDRDSGSTHHPRGTDHDGLAAELVVALGSGSLEPVTALHVADLYAATRSELDPSYSSDWSGLRRVIERGAAASPDRDDTAVAR